MLRINRWISALVAIACVASAQAALLDEARVVAANATLQAMVPQATSCSIATAGTYTLTLSDVQKLSGPGDPFTSLTVVISQGAQFIKQLSLPAQQASNFTTDTVSLATGTYQVQVLGNTPGASQYGWTIQNGNNPAVCQDSDVINRPGANNFSTLQQPLSLTAGQSYTVTLTDQNFPVVLSSLQATITQGSSTTCPLVATATSMICTFTAAATNELFVLASEVTNGAGLYSVKVVNTVTNTVAYAATLPLGTLPPPTTIPFGAAGAYTLNSFDLNTPLALTSLKLALVQFGEVLVKQSAPGGPAAFNAASGNASFYAVAVPASGSPGLYGLQIKQGNTVVYNKVTTVDDPANTTQKGFVYSVALPTAGNYQLQLRDFAFPNGVLPSLSASVTQGSNLLGMLGGVGTLALNNVNPLAGDLSIAVLAQPASNAAGLFGITLTAPNGLVPLEKTQGVGTGFDTQVVTIPAAGHYQVTVSDFSAPIALTDLRAIVTRGALTIGNFLVSGASGNFGFDPTAGDYTISYLLTANPNPGFGMYGVNVVGPPIVLLSSSTTSVNSGGSVTLTWSSTDAAACSASGDWSGSKSISGTTTVNSIGANSAFTLTCTNPAGSTAKTVNVSVQQSSSGKGGGGAWSWTGIFLLFAVVLMQRLMPR